MNCVAVFLIEYFLKRILIYKITLSGGGGHNTNRYEKE